MMTEKLFEYLREVELKLAANKQFLSFLPPRSPTDEVRVVGNWHLSFPVSALGEYGEVELDEALDALKEYFNTLVLNLKVELKNCYNDHNPS